MRGTEFLAALRKCTLPIAELDAHGLTPDEIRDIHATFCAVPRELTTSATGSELEKMILEYDCSSVGIGLVTFLKGPRDHPRGVHVAFCEADPIVVLPSGSVVMCDHAVPDHTTECAADSERFLDALNALAVISYEKAQWKGRYQSAADLCVQRAGGEKYRSFFQMLCGFLS